MSENNPKARMKYARDHKNWTTDDWKRVIWLDESKFKRFQSDGKQYCWRRPGDTIQRHHVMLWGCFTWWHIGPLQNMDGIMKKEDYLAILQTHLPEFVDKNFIVALKDVSVTIPQAVKRGSNAMLTCNYDMENDTLYSVKWYKGRREFYRYTPKENPAMKVFLTQSGLNVERNLSNQSHVVLLAVPLNISGKFTCEISVEAPSFQTAMVSGEMEVVELPEEQASVTGIQPRYRIGDLVDGNCSIKYSKPAANLTWTINGIVVPPHHIKTYQIEKYEETNLESVMSAIHFMVTTQHFIKGQMRLKCTASIFDIFREEIESVIEEDRPRIMASGRSYDAHSYPHDDNGGGYEDHNESYLTYFSAPKSSATAVQAPFLQIVQYFHKLLQNFTILSLRSTTNHICFKLATFIINIERYYEKITHNDMTTYCMNVLLQQWRQHQLIKLITVMAILLKLHQYHKGQWWHSQAMPSGIAVESIATFLKRNCNCKKAIMMTVQPGKKLPEDSSKKITLSNCSYHDMAGQKLQLLKETRGSTTTVTTTCSRDSHFRSEQCLAENQNVINEKVCNKHKTTIESSSLATNGNTIAIDDYQQKHQWQMSQTLDGASRAVSLLSFSAMENFAFAIVCRGSVYQLEAYSHDSFPLCIVVFPAAAAVATATKSNNANYMSRDQTLLMTSNNNTNFATCNLYGRDPMRNATKMAIASSSSSSSTPDMTVTLEKAIALPPSSPIPIVGSIFPSTSPFSSYCLEAFSSFHSVEDNKCLMAFIGELLLHQC
ncbi:beaten path Ic [Haematobia irritans]|uniref:beaten path Ic n=1 Tax=Haematobia irritans TaxID=7368 RepID=UPI003F4FBEB5